MLGSSAFISSHDTACKHYIDTITLIYVYTYIYSNISFFSKFSQSLCIKDNTKPPVIYSFFFFTPIYVPRQYNMLFPLSTRSLGIYSFVLVTITLSCRRNEDTNHLKISCSSHFPHHYIVYRSIPINVPFGDTFNFSNIFLGLKREWRRQSLLLTYEGTKTTL